MNLEGLDTPFTWEYDPTSGFLNYLTYPNGMDLTNSFHPGLNLLTAISYKNSPNGETAASHILMRPIRQQDSWGEAAPEPTGDFAYNGRNELISDQLLSEKIPSSQYGNIGTHKTATKLSATQSPTGAQNNLGLFYLHGEAGERNDQTALKGCK